MVKTNLENLACFSKSDFINFFIRYPRLKPYFTPANLYEKEGYYYMDIDALEGIAAFKTAPNYNAAYIDIIRQRVAKPADCVFTFGIPTDPGLGDLALPAFRIIKSDYLHQPHCDSPARYNAKVLIPLQQFIRFLRKNRIPLSEKITIGQLAELFGSGRRVILLYTHSIPAGVSRAFGPVGEGGIEIDKGCVSAAQVIGAIPKTYMGTFDLCACKPQELLGKLKKERPLCSVRYIEDFAEPKHWYLFYKVLFTILKTRNLS